MTTTCFDTNRSLPAEAAPLRLVAIAETAERLGISPAHLRREIRLKRLAVHRLGRRVLISESDLAAYLAARRRGAR